MFLMYFYIFYCFLVSDIIFVFCTDHAPLRPAGMSPLVWRGAPHGGAGPCGTADEDTDLDKVGESLTQLMIGVPLTRDDDIPIRMRRHASGGGSRFARLFRKVARAVVCYSEYHHGD